MNTNRFSKILSLLLAVCLAFSMMAPAVVSATETEGTGTVIEGGETPTIEGNEGGEVSGGEDISAGTEEVIMPIIDEPYIADYATFLANLKLLEGYAESFATLNPGADNGKDYDPVTLVLNYIRTGVEKYTDSNWTTLAGYEITAFTDYVAAQDALTGNTVRALKNVENFVTPDGEWVEFNHMFGTMNILYLAQSIFKGSGDLGGWAGDICDLVNILVVKGITGNSIDELVATISANHLFVESDIEGVSSFGKLDYYGDIDAMYFVTKIKGEGGKLSQWMESYFTPTLTESDRAAFFLNTRFNGKLTKATVRAAIYNTYSADTMIRILESKRGINKNNDIDGDDIPDCNHADIRIAACYAFADYVFALADGRLVEAPEEPEGFTVTWLNYDGTVLELDENVQAGEMPSYDGATPEKAPVDKYVYIFDGWTPEVSAVTNHVIYTAVYTESILSNPYYTVTASESSTLAPGILQTIETARTADNKQIVYYLATVDVNRSDVNIHANYNNNDPSLGWGMQKVTDQIAAAVKRHTDPTSPLYVENYNPIVGVNADFFNMTNGAPSGALVMEGITYAEARSENFFAILDDGTPMIGSPSEWATYKDRVKEAVGGSIWLVKDGEIVVAPSADYYTSRASRTCIGITAEGKVVLMVLDGRQEPRSAGGSSQEIAQIMFEAGCVDAINLDGGGSTTFAAKQAGSDSITVVNRPSDGFARSVSSSLFVVSTAPISNEFYEAIVDSEYDYVTLGTPLMMTATGVSSTGNSAPIPDDAVWQLSDSTMGLVTAVDGSTGLFIPSSYGTVDIQLVVDGTVVGSKTVNVVVPTTLKFTSTAINTIYGVQTLLPLEASYNNNPVAFSASDVTLALTGSVNAASAGVLDGLFFTGNEASGLRNVTVVAALNFNSSIVATAQINLYRADEAMFDFDNATAGDKTLAWLRDVSNATTSDNVLYQAIVPNAEMGVSYMFALDMTEIAIPEKLQDLTYMLPGNSDGNTTAWEYLLALAERVSVLTEVKVVAQFDMDLDVDISELRFASEYFVIDHNLTYIDETTNTITVIVKWVDQTAAIDPATANPICILSGIKATPKEGAAWDNGNLYLTNAGEVSYDIYLRANALYSFATDPANNAAEVYGLIPFDNHDVITDAGTTEKGAHYQSIYATFNETYILNNAVLQGWHTRDDMLYYYIDHVPLSEGIYKLPAYVAGEHAELYYRFDENGGCIGTVTGLFKDEYGYHYAFDGVLQTGWQSVLASVGGDSLVYYFDTNGTAVDGTQTIGGYTYEFTDCILTKGQFVTNSTGIRYMWAGEPITHEWFNVGDEKYYAQSTGYLATGLYRSGEEGGTVYYAFTDTGLFLENFTGFFEYDETYPMHNPGICYVVNGKVMSVHPTNTADKSPGLIYYPGGYSAGGDYYEAGYYYFVYLNGMVKNSTRWVDNTNGLMKAGSYTFDENGRMVDATTKLISFYVDGELYEEKSYGPGTQLTAANLPENPTKTGYTFKGWTPALPTHMPSNDLTVEASWTINQYTITFNTNGGNSIAAIKQDYGTAVTAPADPVRVGYTFTGWDKEIPTTMPAENVTIKAKWSVNKYTVTFDTDGGSEMSNITANYGASFSTPVNPTKNGYTFAGWVVTNADTGATVDGIPTTIPAYNVKFTAQWTAKSYTIIFDTVDGEFENGEFELEITEKVGTIIEAPADPIPYETGLVFDGWYDIDTGEKVEFPLTMPANDLYLEAVYSAVKYTITFNTDGGNAVAPIVAEAGEVIDWPADPTKTGYTFAGWDKDVMYVMPAENVTVTARWTINEYTITFDTVGGNNIATIKQEYGSAVTAPADPVKTGYTFAGWDKEIPTTMPAENVTITAKWTVNMYTITWYDGFGNVLSTTSLAAGAETEFIGEPILEVKIGYTFLGWDKEIPATMPAEDITIKATWTANTYKIVWADGLNSVTPIKSLDQAYGSDISAIEYPEEPAREGYSFDGWEIANASDNSNMTELPVTMPAHSIIIKATWKINTYTITFDTDGGNEIAPATYEFEEAVEAPADPVKEGYTFLGWEPKIPAVMTGDITVKAQWVKTIEWVTDDRGTKLLVLGEIAYRSNKAFVSENGVDYLYYFDADGYIVYGIHPDNDGNLYVFDLETGRHRADLSGLYTEGEDTYYVEGGIAVKNAGLKLISEQYYYFGADGKAYKNGKFEISNLNGLDIEAGEYTFDEAGRIVLVTVVKGDVDGSEGVDKNDAIYLLYSVLFGDTNYPINQAADFDGSGTVDKNDAIYLLYHALFGATSYPLK